MIEDGWYWIRFFPDDSEWIIALRRLVWLRWGRGSSRQTKRKKGPASRSQQGQYRAV